MRGGLGILAAGGRDDGVVVRRCVVEETRRRWWFDMGAAVGGPHARSNDVGVCRWRTLLMSVRVRVRRLSL